ncbi:CPBP family intramembrane glutamic endopeptidase [Pendulispora albinea]|uniref:CPBP family intramembrane metalloprotease n=1 Tax=Pendulispora albinea TaxID=2741071 RepID=A0ABZ2M4A2_9BACT
MPRVSVPSHLLLVLVVLGVAIPAFFGWQIQHAGTFTFWLLVVVPTLILALLGAIRAQRHGELRDWIKPRWGDATVGVLSGVVLVAAAYAFTRMVSPTGGAREAWLARIYMQIGGLADLRPHTTWLAAGIIVASMAEELVWRGLVTTVIAEQWGSRRAWVVSAVLYAVAHLPAAWSLADPSAGPNLLLPAGALGAGLVWGALVRLKGGSLVSAIIAHAFFDWCVVVMFRLWGNGL